MQRIKCRLTDYQERYTDPLLCKELLCNINTRGE